MASNWQFEIVTMTTVIRKKKRVFGVVSKMMKRGFIPSLSVYLYLSLSIFLAYYNFRNTKFNEINYLHFAKNRSTPTVVHLMTSVFVHT